MTQHEKARFEARMIVVFDNAISAGARLLYIYLDDCANFRGTAWPSQQTVAEKFAVKLRTVKRWYRELRGRHLATTRNKRETAIQSLRWTGALEVTKMSPRVTKMSPQSDKNVPSYLIEPVLIEPVTETCDCDGTGYFPIGSVQPCRECSKGWQMAKLPRRRA